MKALSRNELALMLTWAFRDQKVETADKPHVDAQTLYNNVMALPIQEAATVVFHARSGNVPPSDPIALARWTRGLSMLREMLQQPMCELSIVEPAHAARAVQAA